VAAFGVYRTLATPIIEGNQWLLSANSGLFKAEVTIDWAIVTDYEEKQVQQ
jgi:hypothetical protein